MEKTAQPFGGIIETVKELYKSYVMAIISSCSDEAIKKELEQMGLSKYFKEIIGGTTLRTYQSKKSDAIKSMVEKYSTPKKTISIGDRNVDFIESSRAGLNNILLVDYGWGYDLNKIPEHKQKFIIKKPSELILAISRQFGEI